MSGEGDALKGAESQYESESGEWGPDSTDLRFQRDRSDAELTREQQLAFDLESAEAWGRHWKRRAEKAEKELDVLEELRQSASERAETVECLLAEDRENYRRQLQAWVDAERFDAQFGLRLPGDSALAALLISAEEVLAQEPGE
jgi:hypothetical protein